MSKVYFCTDVHLNHKALPYFGYRNDREGNPIVSAKQNTNLFVEEWKATIKKRDLVYCLGDMAFDSEHNELIRSLLGRKILIKGNHDYLVPHNELLSTYESIEGTHKRYGFWLSHFPVHPHELWGKKCISGHIHHANVLKTQFFDYWEKHGTERRESGRVSNIPHPWPVLEELEDKRYLNLCPENTQLIWNKWIISLEEIKAYFKNTT